jgi:hypothetical protein
MSAYGGNLVGGTSIEPVMRRIVACLAAAALLAACAEDHSDPDGPMLEDVITRPTSFDGREVSVRAAYYSSFEVSVLTSGFAGSHPPQPIEPLVWVAASPERRCTERAQGAAWAERVIATGIFRYDPEGGFGHLGAYRMALEDAELTCA